MENWKDIKGFEGHYQVSDLGRVRSLDRITNTIRGQRKYKGQILSLSNSTGYLKVILTKGIEKYQIKVHILVAQAFLDHNPEKDKIVNHKDTIRTNNVLSNLEITTHRKNISHGYTFKKTSSKYTGVYHKGPNSRGKDWRAIIQINGKNKSLGSFDIEEDARDAYLEAVRNL